MAAAPLSPTGPGEAHPTPPQRKLYPPQHSIISRLHKTTDTQVRFILHLSCVSPPPAEWTSARMEQPPCQLKSPPVRSMHQRPPAPGLSPRAPTGPQPRRHTDEDRSPQGPARAPSRRRSTPEPQAPPPAPDPLRGSQATRPVTYVRQYRPSPSPAARSHEENTL